MLSNKCIVREKGDSRIWTAIFKMRKLASKKYRPTINQKIKNIIGDKQFSMITSNCLAGYFYHDINREFTTPTINLALDGEDFIKFCEDFPRYINGQIDFVKYEGVRYPVGHIDDVEIRFIHYKSEDECIEAWKRRSKRILWDKIVIVTTDRDGMRDPYLLARFDKLPYPKIMFTAKEKPDYDWEICVPQFKGRFQVKVITNFANLRGERYYETCFNLAEWINNNT